MQHCGPKTSRESAGREPGNSIVLVYGNPIMTARSLMILGTASHVGKSIVATALGRILSDMGHRVAPFKAQNMSLNSAATPDGCEIGRAQALQAEACRVTPRAEMNPILIKPSSDTSSQVMVLGRVWGQVTAADYHLKRVEDLFPAVLESYRKLAANYDFVIMEGAGSPAEINLKAHDIVNLRMAAAAGAVCLLVGDIDRGGVFASILGTLQLLEPEERALIRGFVINKFRGDIGLLLPGIGMIEQRIALPCLGVIPYLPDLGLDEEDGVAMEDRRTVSRCWLPHSARIDSPQRPLHIGVVALPHLSNFTDFDALAMEPSVALAFLQSPGEIDGADLVILPGSKQTIDDLDWLEKTGFARALRERCQASGRFGVVGICGGMQMLGEWIDDPTGAESAGERRQRQGLGLLSLSSVLTSEKVTRRASGRLEVNRMFGQPIDTGIFRGYEIHLGETCICGSRILAQIEREGVTGVFPDGAVSESGFVWGTYVHGLFDDDHFRHAFLHASRAAFGLAPPYQLVPIAAQREGRLDRLAAHVRTALGIDQITSWLGIDAKGPKAVSQQPTTSDLS
jgi:adenosylcobyric acid synthase